MLTKRKIEYSAFKLSSLLSIAGKAEPQEKDFSWINVLINGITMMTLSI